MNQIIRNLSFKNQSCEMCNTIFLLQRITNLARKIPHHTCSKLLYTVISYCIIWQRELHDVWAKSCSELEDIFCLKS